MSVWPYTTRRWGRIRLLKLQESPLCEVCLRQFAEVVPAAVVDHRNPISERGRKERLAAEAFPSLEGLASLCESHHNAKTRAEQLGEKNWMRKGCDIFGRPLDPDHPWNKKVKA
jgi:5-methylcytosine-specific restriction enzyme A